MIKIKRKAFVKRRRLGAVNYYCIIGKREVKQVNCGSGEADLMDSYLHNNNFSSSSSLSSSSSSSRACNCNSLIRLSFGNKQKKDGIEGTE